MQRAQNLTSWVWFTTAAVIAVSVESQGVQLDSSFLGSTDQKVVEKKEKERSGAAPAKNSNRSRLAWDEQKKATTASETYETVKSLTYLLKTTPVGLARNSLLLNRATAMNQYARIKILTTKTGHYDENVSKFLQAAIRDAATVLASRQRTMEQVVKSHETMGYSHLYLDNNSEARKKFIEVLRLNPNTESAGWIALIVAEDLFDNADFQLAADYYTRFMPKMSKQGQEIAMYKLAWCMINLKQNDKAEELFVKVARSPSRQGLARDALRDLAFLVAHRDNPSLAIRKTEAMFPSTVDKIDFLSAARSSLESQNAIALHAEVVARLLQLESDPEKRFDLVLADMRVRRKFYASRDHHNAFSRVVDFCKTNSLTPSSSVFKKYETVVETETQAIVKAFIDTYAGKTKSPENIPKSELGESLKRQFFFYHSYFPNTKQYPAIIDLWLQVCTDKRDWECVDYVTQLIIYDQKRLSQFNERAYIDQLAALEQLLKIPDNKKKEDQSERRIKRMKEFIDRFPRSDQWLRVSKLYVQTKSDQGQSREVLPLLERIYNKEQTADAFYRFQYARFQNQEYLQVLDDLRNQKFLKTDAKLEDLLRETCLILAKKMREDNHFDAYRKYIQQFLAYRPTEAKAMIARHDSVSFMIQKELFDQAISEFNSYPETTRLSKEMTDVRVQLWSAAMERGKIQDGYKIIQTAGPEEAFRKQLTRIFLGAVPTAAELATNKPTDRDYLLGVMALTHPESITAMFMQNPARTEADRDLVILALRLESGQWQLTRTQKSVKLLGADYKFVRVDQGLISPLETRMQKVVFPDSKKLKAHLLGNYVKNLAEETRSIRGRVTKEIQGKEPDMQLRIVEKASVLEGKMAEFILNSPVPSELAANQVAEYKKGLEEVAQEFTDQKVQFDKLAGTMREKITKSKAIVSSRLLPQPDMAKWHWPSDTRSQALLKGIVEAAKSKNTLGALTMLDFAKTQLKLDDEEFFNIRTGFLLSGRSSDALRIYLLSELENHRQSDIIEEWADLAGVPAPLDSQLSEALPKK